MHESILKVEDELIVPGSRLQGLCNCTFGKPGAGIIEMKKPFLVLLDIYLHKNLTGMDLAVQLNNRNIPFVYLSANCNQQVMEIAKANTALWVCCKTLQRE